MRVPLLRKGCGARYNRAQTTLTFLVLALASFTAVAQVTPSPAQRASCTAGCTFITDAYPTTGPVPSTCKLYTLAGTVPTFKAQASAVAVTGGVRCQVRTSFPAGLYTVTMTAIDAAGQESPQSVPFAFESVAPLPAPANLRVVP